MSKEARTQKVGRSIQIAWIESFTTCRTKITSNVLVCFGFGVPKLDLNKVLGSQEPFQSAVLQLVKQRPWSENWFSKIVKQRKVPKRWSNCTNCTTCKCVKRVVTLNSSTVNWITKDSIAYGRPREGFPRTRINCFSQLEFTTWRWLYWLHIGEDRISGSLNLE